MKIQLKQWNPCLLVGLRQTKANKSTAMGVFHSLRWWVARGDGVVAIQPFLWAARTSRHLSFRKLRFVGCQLRAVCVDPPVSEASHAVSTMRGGGRGRGIQKSQTVSFSGQLSGEGRRHTRRELIMRVIPRGSLPGSGSPFGRGTAKHPPEVSHLGPMKLSTCKQVLLETVQTGKAAGCSVPSSQQIKTICPSCQKKTVCGCIENAIFICC